VKQSSVKSIVKLTRAERRGGKKAGKEESRWGSSKIKRAVGTEARVEESWSARKQTKRRVTGSVTRARRLSARKR
jgi:hypothetical protein